MSSVPVDDTAVAPGIPPPENKVFYPALDGLRAFAVLLVFAQHYVLQTKTVALRWGWTGVDLFFVLSGFLITGILYDTRDTPHPFRNFYARRTLRIFPLFYGVLLLTLLLTPVLRWNWQPIWLLWPFYLGNYTHFIHPVPPPLSGIEVDNLLSLRFGIPFYFGHFWSLCVEEQFYLLWPLVVFAVRDRVRLRHLCFAVILLTPLVRIALCFLLPPVYLDLELLYRATPLRADALLIGGALALILRGPEAHRLRRMGWPLLVSSVTTLLLGWAAATELFHAHQPTAVSTPWMGGFGFTLIDLAAAGLILLALEPGNLVHRAFSLRPLRRLGQVSYGFYIFHDLPHVFYTELAHTLLHRSGGHAVGLLTVSLALVSSTALAFLSFRYFEAPFLRLKDHFTA